MSAISKPRKDYNFIYDAVNLFEQGDRAFKHNQFGAHVFTPELQELFGARRGEPLPDNPRLFTAYYDTPEIGSEASKYIIDKIWEKNGGNEIGFATQYTGLPENHPTVINYAGEIRRRKTEKDKENAKRRALNVLDIEKNKAELVEEFPEYESKISQSLKDGKMSLQDLKTSFKKSRMGVKYGVTTNQEQDTAVRDNLTAGFKDVASDFAKMADYVLSSDDFIERLPATDATKSMLRGSDKSVGSMVSPILKKFAGQMDAEVAKMDKEYAKDLNKEFEVSDLGNPNFYKTKIARGLPATLSLMAPAIGVARTVGGLKGAVAGTMATRPIESGMEALGLYESLIEQGVDQDTASIEASELYNKNMSLFVSDGAQLGLALAHVPAPMRNVLGKYVSTIAGVGLGAFTEGAEEVVQNFFIEQGQASALGNPEPEFMDALALSTPQQKEAFAIGALMGAGFQVAGQTLTKQQVDNIIDEEQEKYINLQQAKELEDIAPVTVEQEFFQDRVNNLKKHGDAIDIGFVDSEVRQVFTADQLLEYGYFNLEEFQQAKLKEGDEGYVNDGQDRYELAIPATNYQTGDSDAQRVLLSRSATTADFLEDTAEAVLRRLQTTNPQLANDIFGWVDAVERVAEELDVQLPYGGAELFSKSFVYNSLGYADQGALPDFTVMPDALQDAFVQELELNDGSNLLDSMTILGQQAEPTQAVDYTPIEIDTQSPNEMFALGERGQGGIFVMGGDAIARDAKGRRSVEGIRYPEKFSGWQLSEGGATALENYAKAGNNVIAIYQYPSQTANESNPRFQEAYKRERAKNERRVKKNRKTQIQLRKDVERMVTEPDINLNRGKILYVAEFDKVLRGEERTRKHSTYPAQVVFKNVKELPRPLDIQDLTDSIDPSVSNNARTFISSRDLRARSSNLYLLPSESPVVQEIRNFAEGKESTLDQQQEPSRVMSSFRIQGEQDVQGVFDSINSERELAYMGTMSDIAKDLNLQGRPAQAGAVTNEYGKENGMVFTVENPDLNSLDLYIAYAGLLGNQYSILHFNPNTGNDSIHINNESFEDISQVRELSEMYASKDIDHTVEIRGSQAQFIFIDPNSENIVTLKDKGVIDDNTRTITGSIEFRESQDSKFQDASTPEKERRKLARDYWQSEIDRLQEAGYTSEAGESASSDRKLKSRLAKGKSGFSVRVSDTDASEFFNQKISRKQKRRIRRAQRESNPRQLRDYYRTWSSQMRRAFDKLMNPIIKFQKRELDIKREYMQEAKPFLKVLSTAFKRGNRKLKPNKEMQSAYANLSLALKNGNETDIVDILTNVEFFKRRNALNKWNQFRRAHEKLHKKAFKSGLKLKYIDTHFPRVMVNHSAYLDDTFGILPNQQRSRLQEILDKTAEEEGRPLIDEEKAEIANRYMKDMKGVTNSQKSYNLKSRKIETLRPEQLKYYAHPHEAMGMYINSMAGIIAQSEFMGRSKDIYKIRLTDKTVRVAGRYVRQYGIFDQRIKEFVRGENGEVITRGSKDNPQLIKEMEARIEQDDYEMGDLTDMPIEDQIGMMMIRLENEAGVIPRGKEERVRNLLKNYFEMRQSGQAVYYIKNIGYMTSMGSPSSAITQLADLGGAYYRSVEGDYANPMNVARFFKAFTKALTNKSTIDLQKLGVDDTLLQELTGQGSALNKLFKLTGLRFMDRVGKETYVNSVISRYQKQAKTFLKNRQTKNDAKFQARLEDKFEQAELPQVIKDLADGKNTQLVQLLAYSELLDVQPVAKSEVPVRYLDMPNGRVFYMLKTFMLKRIDFFGKERQIVFKQAKVLERQGKIKEAKQLRMSRGYAPVIQLAIILTLAEAGADTIKDVMFGRKTTLSDLVISNILKLILISRYTFYNFAHDPLYGLFKAIAPPSDVVTDPMRDIVYFGRQVIKNRGDFEKAIDKANERGYRTPKNIPWIGKFLHWRKTNWLSDDPDRQLGYGQKQIKKREKKKKKVSIENRRF